MLGIKLWSNQIGCPIKVTWRCAHFQIDQTARSQISHSEREFHLKGITESMFFYLFFVFFSMVTSETDPCDQTETVILNGHKQLIVAVLDGIVKIYKRKLSINKNFKIIEIKYLYTYLYFIPRRLICRKNTPLEINFLK